MSEYVAKPASGYTSDYVFWANKFGLWYRNYVLREAYYRAQRRMNYGFPGSYHLAIINFQVIGWSATNQLAVLVRGLNCIEPREDGDMFEGFRHYFYSYILRTTNFKGKRAEEELAVGAAQPRLEGARLQMHA